MDRIFVSGSSTGLGLLTGRKLLAMGHEVVFHARNNARADDLRRSEPGATKFVVGDLDTVEGCREVAEQVNAIVPMTAVIHNAGIGYGSERRQTSAGLLDTFAVNVLAPYVLTAVIHRPRRLVYLSSGMHRTEPHLEDAQWESRRWSGWAAYSESKLYVTMLSLAVARLWPDTASNAVDPGWVPTRMGGRGAPDDLDEGCATQIALATGAPFPEVTGGYFHHMSIRPPAAGARNEALQEQLLGLCRKLSGLRL